MPRRKFEPVKTYTPFYQPPPAHKFEGSPADDFKCALCGKPRALHADPPDPYRFNVTTPPTDETRPPE